MQMKASILSTKLLLTVQFVASAIEWFWSIHIFALFIILNGSKMSQSSHESTEVYLVLSD